jgi:hypothetical protein
MLILPGHPLFDLTLMAPRPDWQQVAAQDEQYAFVAEPGSGLMRPVTQSDLEDYLWGGEYDERLEEIEEDDLD